MIEVADIELIKNMRKNAQGKDVKAVSRKEALEIALNFCRNNAKPTVVAEIQSIYLGLGGVTLSTNDDPNNIQALYFPAVGEESSTQVPVMERVALMDRLSVVHFYDQIDFPIGIDELDTQTLLLVDLEHCVYGEIPNIVVSRSKAVEALLRSQILQNNLNEYFSNYFFVPMNKMVKE